MNRYYKIGTMIGGVAEPEWSVSQYQAQMRKIWAAAQSLPAAAPFAVIQLARNGGTFKLSPFTSKDDAADLYSSLADKPIGVSYLAMFDRDHPIDGDPMIDEAYFDHTVETVEIERPTPPATPAPTAPPKQAAAHVTDSPMAVKVGVGIVAAIGVLALIAKH